MNKLLLVLLISMPTVASCDAQSSGKSNGAASERGGRANGKSEIDLKQQEQAAKAFERAANTTAHPPPK
jgi:hypothetical protein